MQEDSDAEYKELPEEKYRDLFDKESIREEKAIAKRPLQDVPHSSMSKLPFSNIGNLKLKSGEDRGRGTGILIAPDLILTCAHNVHFKSGKNIEEATFLTYQDGTFTRQHQTEPYPFYADKFRTVQGRITQNDYALIKLKQKTEQKQFLKLKVIEDIKQLHPDAKIMIYGTKTNEKKSQEKGKIHIEMKGCEQYWSVLERYPSSNNKVLNYGLSTFEGFSGTPIILEDENERQFIIGIHTAAHQSQYSLFNCGVLFTTQILEQLRKSAKKMRTSFEQDTQALIKENLKLKQMLKKRGKSQSLLEENISMKPEQTLQKVFHAKDYNDLWKQMKKYDKKKKPYITRLILINYVPIPQDRVQKYQYEEVKRIFISGQEMVYEEVQLKVFSVFLIQQRWQKKKVSRFSFCSRKNQQIQTYLKNLQDKMIRLLLQIKQNLAMICPTKGNMHDVASQLSKFTGVKELLLFFKHPLLHWEQFEKLNQTVKALKLTRLELRMPKRFKKQKHSDIHWASDIKPKAEIKFEDF